MAFRMAAPLAAFVLTAAVPVVAQDAYGGVGSLVSVSVEVNGQPSPLYAAVDGSGRYYVQAWRGAQYCVRLVNRSGERLGVLLTVDGLNAISGERSWPGARGRMYVLSPWDETVVRGWRTSLDEVRRFTFVDEERSYATRSGKASARLGWIEVEVYREARAVARPWPYWPPYTPDAPYPPYPPYPPSEDDAREKTQSEPEAKDDGAAGARDGYGARPAPPSAAPAYPGTGWGPRADDPVRVVSFEPQAAPAERITLRYEYASGLRALGILPRPWWSWDRLRQRDRGQEGFARPPYQ